MELGKRIVTFLTMVATIGCGYATYYTATKSYLSATFALSILTLLMSVFVIHDVKKLLK